MKSVGTNYYLLEDYCTHCKKGERVHLGKHSAGWRFAMSALVYKTYGDWFKRLNQPNTVVVDEYGMPEPVYELVKSFENKKDLRSIVDLGDRWNKSWKDGPVDMYEYEFS